MFPSKQCLKPICNLRRNNLWNLNKLTSLPLGVPRPRLYGSQCSTKAALWDLNRIHRLSFLISCRNPCTVPEFKSVHEYGTVQLEFPYGKAACHSERQHQLLSSQAWNTEFRDYDKSGRPGLADSYVGLRNHDLLTVYCMYRRFWSTAPQTEDRDTRRQGNWEGLHADTTNQACVQLHPLGLGVVSGLVFHPAGL